MIEAVLWPSKAIAEEYEAFRIEMGYEVFLGMIMQQDGQKLAVLLPEEVRPIILPRAKVTDVSLPEVSIMPEGLLDEYDLDAISGLFEYLQQGPDLSGAALREPGYMAK